MTLALADQNSLTRLVFGPDAYGQTESVALLLSLIGV